MRLPLKALGLGLALAAAAAFIALHHARAQDGTPDASGNWTGKVGFKEFPLDAIDGNGSRGSVDAAMQVNQNGGSLSVDLTVQGSEGTEEYSLYGNIGNGHFFATNGNGAFPFLLSGHLTGTGAKVKMKGAAIAVNEANAVNELTFSFRRAPAAK